MTLRRLWRDFICDPGRAGRHLGGLGGASAAASGPPIEPEVLARFVEKLGRGPDAVELLADAIDLAHPGYEEFCHRHLVGLLDSLANETAVRQEVIGPALRGAPRWDLTAVARCSGRLRRDQFVARLPTRSFALPENMVVRWLVGSLSRGVASLERRLGSSGIATRHEVIRRACANALGHEWFRAVPEVAAPSASMLLAAARQRLPAYRVAATLAARRAARESGGRAARHLRTLDLLAAEWLEPVSDDEIFELYTLTLVLDVLEHELGLGAPVEFGLAVSGRDHVARFRAPSDEEVLVFFDQSPASVLGVPSRYLGLLDAHEGVSGSPRRPDVTVVRVGRAHRVVALVEAKQSADAGYMSDSVYKAMGYVHDFQALWDEAPGNPKVVVLFPERVSPRLAADLRALEVALVHSFDRPVLARAIGTRLGLEIT
ncbi:hypothetical protein GXW77_08895 [Roseomonas alkaliterrae]|uniref:Restriction endonuclease n=1 Tax=Neoroseomonas alkaliterrae TaxID=1452450 RepID=A0A840XZ03_9PROT|nr:hypothetical protein [Neoroseomonas alkaliterrae]MBB5691839.1 hypothetical protein [Neoroseomonas alkaliterrae]MBR0676287.1 hypothetical protein [Neoroseomonas alkaliterrae]